MPLTISRHAGAAPFGTCVHRLLARGSLCAETSAVVRFEPATSTLCLLRPAEAHSDADAEALPFGHTWPCPIAHLEDRRGIASPPPPTLAAAGSPSGASSSFVVTSGTAPEIRLAVAVVVQASDGCILLTQRAAHLRSFGGAWVVPGGHIEKSETLEAAGARELAEEVGIGVACEAISPLCVWESSYPDTISDRVTHQHVIVYMKASLPQTSAELERSIRVQASEVQAVCCCPRELLLAATSGGPHVRGADAVVKRPARAGSTRALAPLRSDPRAEHAGEAWHALSELDPDLALRLPLGTLADNLTAGTRFAIRACVASPRVQQQRPDSGGASPL